MFHAAKLESLLTANLSQMQRQIVVSPLYEVIKKIRSDEWKCEDILRSALQQQDNMSHLRAFMPRSSPCTGFYEEQIEKLNTRCANERGILHGIPIAVKDNFCTTYPATNKGETTTAGSKILQNFESPYNATVVERIINTGGIVIGKTSLDEFGMGSTTSHCGLMEPTINPWSALRQNPTEQENILSSGGSSGGSAVAVASYCSYAALGSDTGGSVRQPAAWNGIIGLKPSYGTLSRFGLIAYGSSLDCPGIFARNIADTSLVLDQLSGPDFNDNCTQSRKKLATFEQIENLVQEKNKKFVSASGRKIRVGLPKEYWVNEMSPEISDCWRNVASLMSDAGAEIIETSLPHTQHALPVYLIIANAEASSNLARYDGVRYGYRTSNASNVNDLVQKSRLEAIGNEVQRRIIMGTFALSRDSYESFFLRSQLVRRLIKEDFDRCFEDQQIDVLLTPTAPSLAKTLKEARDTSDPVSEYMNDLMTIPANLAGIPALSIPVGMSNELPIGMQLMAQAGNESRLLEVSAILENNLKQ